MSVNPPFKYACNLNGLAYYQVCPVLYSHEQSKELTFKYHNYTTQLEPCRQLVSVRTITYNSLVLLLEGEVHLNWDEYKDVVIRAGEMFFLPRGAEVSGYIEGSVSFVTAVIGRLMTGKEMNDIRMMKGHEEFDKYEFKPMEMRPPMLRLAESVKEYLTSGVNCSHLHKSKACELYVILHWYYSLSENAELFYSMMGTISEFRDFVLDNFNISTKISDMLERAHMSRSTFDRKFRETFGTTPRLWIEEQTRQMIVSKASEPNVTVKDIMYEVGVYNPSQFTKLCRRLCGVTPSALIRPK